MFSGSLGITWIDFLRAFNFIMTVCDCNPSGSLESSTLELPNLLFGFLLRARNNHGIGVSMKSSQSDGPRSRGKGFHDAWYIGKCLTVQCLASDDEDVRHTGLMSMSDVSTSPSQTLIEGSVPLSSTNEPRIH